MDGVPTRRGRLQSRWLVSGVGLVTLAFAVSPAAAFDAEVVPQRANVGERSCFEFSAVERDGKPHAGARIQFLGKHARTSADGEARICATPRWPGVHTAWVSNGSARPKGLEVSARGEANLAGAGWHPFVAHFDAYGSWGRCSDAYSDASSGACFGTLQGGGWNSTAPMHESNVRGAQFEWSSGRPMSVALYNANSFYSGAKGFVPGAESGALTITSGYADGWYSAWAGAPWPLRTYQNRLQSGTDMSKLGSPGGPVRISVGARGGSVFSSGGYTVDLNGYLWY